MTDAWLSDTRSSYDTDASGYAEKVRGLLGGRPTSARAWRCSPSWCTAPAGRRRWLRAGVRHRPPPRRRSGRLRHRSLARDDRHRPARLSRPALRGRDDDRPRPDGRLGRRHTRVLVRDPRARPRHPRRVRGVPSSVASAGSVRSAFTLATRQTHVRGLHGSASHVDSHRRQPSKVAGWLRDAGFTIEAELVIGPDEDVPGPSSSRAAADSAVGSVVPTGWDLRVDRFARRVPSGRVAALGLHPFPNGSGQQRQGLAEVERDQQEVLPRRRGRPTRR